MDYASIIKAGSRVAKAAARYIDKDLHAYYGISKPAWASFKGAGIGVLGCSLEVGVVEAGPLTVYFFSEDQVRLECVPFEPASKLWNGPNVLPDNLRDGSFEMSLWHDLVWELAEVIGVQLDVPEQTVMEWGDGVLNAAYKGYGEKHGKKVGRRAWIAFNVCEWSRHWWRRLFKSAVCMALAGALLAGCSGCAMPPPWELEDASEIEFVCTNAPATEVECPTP